MELNYTVIDVDDKPNLESVKPICRCCLATEKNVFNVVSFAAYFKDLANIDVTGSDGMPQWLCWECIALLKKAVRFKHKLLQAHNLLYEYLTRCAPFPIDAQDSELQKYSSPSLTVTETLLIYSCSDTNQEGSYSTLQHKKIHRLTELDDIELPQVSKEEVQDTQLVKEENGLSDYEDNITLDEYKININNLPDDELDQILHDTHDFFKKEENNCHKQRKKSKRKVEKVKKKKKKKKEKDIQLSPIEGGRSSIRMPVELDPTKIRVVMLNPQEQIKQREEEMKATFKFPYQCNLCFKGFNFEGKLQNHMSKHSPSRGKFECKLCKMYLPTQYSYKVHSVIHTRRYECVPCGRRMTDRCSILDHYRSQHEGLMTIYTCQLCGKVSNNSKTHRGHLRNHHAGERPKCDQCGKSFVNKDSLTEHLQIHQGIKNYECSICKQKFRTRTQIKHHQLKHSDLKLFYCVECDVRFKSAHSLQQHLRKSLKHKDRKTLPFACSTCDKRYESESRLRAHVSIQHEGVRAHACSACGAALASRASLHKHVMAVHVGRRDPPKHVCDTCGKAFRGKSVLVNHVRTHTGEKPFACETCGRKFTQRAAMNTHVKLVHLKLPRGASTVNKIKPELPIDNRDMKPQSMFNKDEPQITVYESWPRSVPCDYFTVTAGP